MINFEPLFLTARVMTAIYRIAITAVLLATLTRRIRSGERLYRTPRRLD